VLGERVGRLEMIKPNSYIGVLNGYSSGVFTEGSLYARARGDRESPPHSQLETEREEQRNRGGSFAKLHLDLCSFTSFQARRHVQSSLWSSIGMIIFALQYLQ
jgi:hypothetical protein